MQVYSCTWKTRASIHTQNKQAQDTPGLNLHQKEADSNRYKHAPEDTEIENGSPLLSSGIAAAQSIPK
jgi:hypothetical protein